MISILYIKKLIRDITTPLQPLAIRLARELYLNKPYSGSYRLSKTWSWRDNMSDTSCTVTSNGIRVQICFDGQYYIHTPNALFSGTLSDTTWGFSTWHWPVWEFVPDFFTKKLVCPVVI